MCLLKIIKNRKKFNKAKNEIDIKRKNLKNQKKNLEKSHIENKNYNIFVEKKLKGNRDKWTKY